MKLIAVNSDDAGLHPGTDQAILKCARDGIVRNATVIINGPTAGDFIARANGDGLETGLHINLTHGLAMAGPASTLTDEGGNFLQPKSVIWQRAMSGQMDSRQVWAEIKAQIETFYEMGGRPLHVDGHNHVHLFPQVREVLAEMLPYAWFRTPDEPGFDRTSIPDLGDNFNLWSKDRSGPWPRTDRFAGHSFCRKPSVDSFLASLDHHARFMEFMVHTGSRPGSAFVSSPDRDLEVEIMCDDRLKNELQQSGYRLVTFREAGELCI